MFFVQLINYTWTKVHEFFANSGKTLVGTLTTGRENIVAVEDAELNSLQSWKDLVDNFNEAVYIMNEKLLFEQNNASQ